MNRRAFMRASAGVLATLVPTWMVQPARRRTIDLQSFCAKKYIHDKYDMTAPFRQDGWLYATDAHLCVRVEPLTADVEGERADLPPASSLPWWDHDRLRGWRPFAGEVLMAHGDCPTCGGYGTGEGLLGDSRTCPDCKGRGLHPIDLHPCIVRIGDTYLDRRQCERIRRLAGAECVVGLPVNPLRFRAEGVDGLLVPLDPETARRRVEGRW